MENEKLGEMTVEEDTDGKAVWVFEGKIRTDVPLETEAKDIVGAINELFQSGSGGGDVFLVSGSGSGITVTMVKNRGETQELDVEMFTFNNKTYKTITTVSSGNTQIEKIWSKSAISEVLKDGVTVWKFTLDVVGTVTAVLDSVGNDVINGVTGEDGNSVITPTPEGIALGWALAYNNEQSSAMQKAIDAYRDGISDCDEINAAEGVGGGNGDGDGEGDGNGGDGNGDGTGGSGGKIPEKSFGKYSEIPLNDDGTIPIPFGSGAFRDEEPWGYKCDVIIIDVSQGTDKVRIGMFNNDGSLIEGWFKRADGEWVEGGLYFNNGFVGGYQLIGGVLCNNNGNPLNTKFSGDIYYVT